MRLDSQFESTKLNILVAEDEEYNFLFISEVLKDYNVNLIRAYNGKMAIDLVQQKPDIDLVLMDVGMPVMDGLEATKRIKSLRPELPIIIQTAYSHLSDKHMALESGCDCFMAKPIVKTELFKCLEKYKPIHAVLEKV
ncbi:response regulator [Mangrovibacterium lignilyticum]|uniref:response regulator n=1 Tax=Mangrovibacterium lignilyticum TaxID=2668052 RepID=UPI0013D7E84D|nr:response regulator [Mangrovibacterium lignilyticum]